MSTLSVRRPPPDRLGALQGIGQGPAFLFGERWGVGKEIVQVIFKFKPLGVGLDLGVVQQRLLFW